MRYIITLITISALGLFGCGSDDSDGDGGNGGGSKNGQPAGSVRRALRQVIVPRHTPVYRLEMALLAVC